MKQKLKGHLHLAQKIVDLLENKFSFMGLRFGLDPLLGLIPGFGDFFTFIFAAYIVWIGVRMELPRAKISQMVFNIVLDLAIGVIPVIGDIGDFAFKANSRNLQILKDHDRTYIEGELVT